MQPVVVVSTVGVVVWVGVVVAAAAAAAAAFTAAAARASGVGSLPALLAGPASDCQIATCQVARLDGCRKLGEVR